MNVDLSICVIWEQLDAEFLNGNLASAPIGSEIILIETVPSENLTELGMSEIEVKELDNGTVIKSGQWKYFKNQTVNNFSFSNAINACKELATREWICKLDADERLCIDANELEAMKSIPKEVGALLIPLHNYTKPQVGQNKATCSTIQICRMFRNIKEFKYFNRCHEQILPSILKLGYKVATFTALIKHLGYVGSDPEVIKRKLIRNHELMLKDLVERPNDAYLLVMERNTLVSMTDLGLINKAIE